MADISDIIAATGAQNEGITIVSDMVSTINSTANSIHPDHDAILKDIREKFEDDKLTLTTLSDEQIGLYFLPSYSTDVQAIAGARNVIERWDRLYHEAMLNAKEMPQLVKNI